MKKSLSEKELLNKQYIVPALYRGLKVIELLSEHPEGLSIGNMAELKFPPASLYRMLMTLLERKYVVREGNDLYRLSRKLLSLGYKAIDESGILEKSLSAMRKLRDVCGETVLIAVRHGNEGVVLEEVVSSHPVKVTVQVGHHFPLHTAAPGKAMLAYLPEEEKQSIINAISYTVFNSKTITDISAMESELARVKESGVAFDRGEEIEEIRCVGAPVFNYLDYPVAAIWISGPSSRMPEKIMKTYAALVKEYAGEISVKFL